MGITFGWIITGIAITGIIACTIGLLVANRVFAKQREKMLRSIERE